MGKIRNLLTILIITLFALLSAKAQSGPLPADYNAAFGGGQGFVVNNSGDAFSVRVNNHGEIIVSNFSRITIYDSNGNLLRTTPAIYGATRIALDGNDIIAVAGHRISPTEVDVQISRYDRNLNLNTKFGNNGVINFRVPNYLVTIPNVVAVQSNGRIVIAGVAQNDQEATDFQSFVARFNPKGDLDQTFRGNGYLVEQIGYAHAPESLGLVGNGANTSIILGGWMHNCINCDYFATLAVYDRSGNPDPGFNQGNIFTMPGKPISGAFAVQPDGKIILSNVGSGRFGVARILPNGTLDPTFGVSGIATTLMPAPVAITGVGLDLLGRIVISGMMNQTLVPPITHKMFAARYNPDGTLDTTFAATPAQSIPAGTRVLEFPNEPSHFAVDQALMGNQIILVGRLGNFSPTNRSAMVKLNGQ